MAQTLTRTPARGGRVGIAALTAAMIISNTGNFLTAIAVPWFVLETTGSAAKTGLVAFFGLLPVAASGVFGGAVVDRLGFRRASIVADLASGVTVCAIPVLHALGVLEYWHLLALAFCGAIFDVPGSAARQALLPALAERSDMPLERANALFQIGQFAASVVGPLTAGLLIVAFDAANVIYFDAASFAVSAAIVALAIHAPRVSAPQAESASPFAGAFDGLRYIRTERVLLLFVILTIFGNLVFGPLFAVVFPVYAKHVFDTPTALGLIEASFGLGSVLGALAYGALGARVRRFPLFVACGVVGSVGMWSIALASTLAWAVVGCLLAGLAIGPTNALVITVIQERTPEALLGRVLGALFAAGQLITPLGVVAAGFLIAGVGVRTELLAIATGFSAVMLAALLQPGMRTLDETRARPSGAEPALPVH